jgi:hypothetical protein
LFVRFVIVVIFVLLYFEFSLSVPVATFNQVQTTANATVTSTTGSSVNSFGRAAADGAEQKLFLKMTQDRPESREFGNDVLLLTLYFETINESR